MYIGTFGTGSNEHLIPGDKVTIGQESANSSSRLQPGRTLAICCYVAAILDHAGPSSKDGGFKEENIDTDMR